MSRRQDRRLRSRYHVARLGSREKDTLLRLQLATRDLTLSRQLQTRFDEFAFPECVSFLYSHSFASLELSRASAMRICISGGAPPIRLIIAVKEVAAKSRYIIPSSIIHSRDISLRIAMAK